MRKNGNLHIAVAMLVACSGVLACPTVDAATLRCNDGSPKKDVKIRYGDSYLNVDIKEKKVRRDDYLVFDLKPDMGLGPPPNLVDFKQQAVQITPKYGNQSWPSGTGSYSSSGGKLVICVPSDLPFGTYEYEITIDNVGKLDPRITVEP